MSSSKKVTIGYKYRLGLHMIFCHGPVDKITKLVCDNKTFWTGTSTGGTITVSQEGLFGGEEKEGGLAGTIHVQMGKSDQVKNSYLQSLLGTNIPAFRGVMGLILEKFYIGTQKSLKAMTMRASRIHTRQDGIAQWYDAKSEVQGDMNPAHIIRECLTDPDWGLGYADGDIDDASFVAAADKLYTEGMGMSILWDKSVELQDFLGQVLKHIDGSLYVHPSTGKFFLKLARNDYNIATILALGEDDIVKVTDYKRNTVGELTNSITVVYWDKATGKDGSVTIQDIALVANQGATNGTTVRYPGFTRSALATQVASRDLQVLTTPLASATVYAGRKAADLNLGDVFKMSWPDLDIGSVVFRVLNKEVGNLKDNQVKLSVIEDIFALPSAVYAPPPPTAWTNPVNLPVASPYHKAYEAPYYELARRFGDATAQAMNAANGYGVLAASRPTSDAIDAQFWTNPGSGYYQQGLLDFTPIALLNGAIGKTETVIPIKSGVDLSQVATGSYLLVDNEAMSVNALSSNSMTVGRGCLDTVPAAHADNAVVFFSDENGNMDPLVRVSGEIPKFKSLTTTGLGVLAIASAPEQSFTMVARANKPYPPQKIRINGQAWPTTIPQAPTMNISWVNRNRLTQTSALVDTEAANITPEAGQTTTVKFENFGGTTLLTKSGLTGTSVDLTTSEVLQIIGNVRMKVSSDRGGVVSFQEHSHDMFVEFDTSWTPASLFTSGQKGVWYDPSDLSTLFQDAAGTIPVTTHGDPVGLMMDKSGNGMHASQTTSTKRPLFQDVAGIRSLKFDGVDDFLVTANANWAGVPGGFCTASVKRNSTTTQIYMELTTDTNTVNGSFFIAGNNASNNIASARGTAVTTSMASGASGTGNFCLSVKIDTTKAATTDKARHRANTSTWTGASINPGVMTWAAAPLYIGMRAGTTIPSSMNYYQGVIVIELQANDDKIGMAEYYCKQKGGF